MSENMLEKIIKKKIERINILKKSISLKFLDEKIVENKSFINFKNKIQNNLDSNKVSIILLSIIFSNVFLVILYSF